MSRPALLLLAALALTAAPDISAGGRGEDKKDERKDELKLTADEQAVLDFTNAERKKEDLPPLKANAQLMEAAREHAKNMAKQDKLEHILDEKNPGDRAKVAGYKYSALGENIAWNQKAPKDVVAGWMDSEGHRANILNKDYTEIGVAVRKNDKGEPYWVQVFGKP